MLAFIKTFCVNIYFFAYQKHLLSCKLWKTEHNYIKAMKNKIITDINYASFVSLVLASNSEVNLCVFNGYRLLNFKSEKHYSLEAAGRVDICLKLFIRHVAIRL